MKLFIATLAVLVLSCNAAPAEKRNVLGGLAGLFGGGGGGGAGGILGSLGGLLGGGGATSGTAAATGTGTAAAGTGTAAAGTATGAAAGPSPGALGAIDGINAVFNLANTLIAHGHNDPSNGADMHHHGAEHGAQNAILSALANGDFVVGK